MVEFGNGGRIVNTSSISGITGCGADIGLSISTNRPGWLKCSTFGRFWPILAARGLYRDRIVLPNCTTVQLSIVPIVQFIFWSL